MYIQITTRCNMSCPHCCYNCTKEGVDMPLSTFLKALRLCVEHDEHIFLGGGEPTLHPRFERILLEAMSTNAELDSGLGPVGIITNGSIRRRAKMLYNLHQQSIVWAALSLDKYHDAIDADIMEMFKQKNMIHDTTKNDNRDPLPHGRARDLLGLDDDDDDYGGAAECPCSDWLIQPDGLIRQCGCEDAPIVGNVTDGIESPARGTCHRDTMFTAECIAAELEHLLS